MSEKNSWKKHHTSKCKLTCMSLHMSMLKRTVNDNNDLFWFEWIIDSVFYLCTGHKQVLLTLFWFGVCMCMLMSTTYTHACHTRTNQCVILPLLTFSWLKMICAFWVLFSPLHHPSFYHQFINNVFIYHENLFLV